MADPGKQGVLLRNARIGDGSPVDIRITGGTITQIGPGLRGEELLDARGGAVIPGLIDHHIHLLATAAAMDSVQLDDAADAEGLAAMLRAAAARRAPGTWLRATGYHERIAGRLDRDALDRIVPAHRLRVQHQTGALWMLNSAALDAIGDGDWPHAMERDAAGRADGRLFRADRWLRERIGKTPPPLGPLGRRLARFGITGVSDASVTNDAQSAALLAGARRAGELPLRLMLMSGGDLPASTSGDYRVGPVKILLDDDALPPLDTVLETIAMARRSGRAVAAHCVTAGELALMLAALETAGSRAGDRIEHGGVIPAEAIAVLRRMGLCVVTQSGFIDTRGERYRALVDPAEHDDLYRCASLIAGGVCVAGSSDGPYGDLDPWRAMRAAIHRRTAAGHPLAQGERIDPARAMALYLGDFGDPGGPSRRVETGAPADLCVLGGPLSNMLARPDANGVAATIAAGQISWQAG